jgi:hypothetical protein
MRNDTTAPSNDALDTAFRQLVEARLRYEALRGAADSIPELTSARFALDDARLEAVSVRRELLAA